MKRTIGLFILLASCGSTPPEVQAPKTEVKSDQSDQKDMNQEASTLAAQASAPPKAHLFLPNPDGTVLDTTNGQLWLGADHGKANWEKANELCANETAGGKKDWRLPTAEELRVLYYSADEPHYPECSEGQSDKQQIHHPKAIYLSCYQYWAKDSNGDRWAFFMENDRFQFKPGADTPYYAICVHDK